MNIGFDFDKIFVDYPPLVPAILIDRIYKKKSNGILLYRIPSRPEQIIRRISHHHRLRPMIKENLIVLQTISDQNNHKLYLISSRFGFLKKPTNKIVRKHELEKFFHGLHFNFNDKQPHVFKDELIKQLAIERYVDDDLPLLKFLAKENPKTLFFWLNNKKKEKISRNLFAITHLGDVLK